MLSSRILGVPRLGLLLGETRASFQRCLATAAPSEGEKVGQDKSKDDKKEKDPHKLLNYQIFGSKLKLTDVAALVLNTPEEAFNHVNTASSLYRLGRMISNTNDKLTWEHKKAAQKLLKMATKQTFDPRSCSNMCFGAAVAQLNLIDGASSAEFTDHIAKDQSAQIAKYNPKQLTVVGWSFAMLKANDRAFMEQIFSEAASRSATDFEIRDMPKLIWAMGHAGVSNDSLIKNVTGYLKQSPLDSLEPNDLSGIVNGLGKLKVRDDELLKRVSNEIVETRKGFEEAGFSLQGMSRLMFGLSLLSHKDDNLIQSALDILQRRAKYLRHHSRTELIAAMKSFGVDDFDNIIKKVDEERLARKLAREQKHREIEAALETKKRTVAEKFAAGGGGSVAVAPST